MRPLARLRRHATYANVVATLALFVAVSTGGAVASGWIDGRTIKPNSIPGNRIMNNSITSAKIKNGQITAADVKKGSLPTTVLDTTTQQQLSTVGVGPDGEHVVGQPCKVTVGGAHQGKIGVWGHPPYDPKAIECNYDENFWTNGAVNA